MKHGPKLVCLGALFHQKKGSKCKRTTFVQQDLGEIAINWGLDKRAKMQGSHFSQRIFLFEDAAQLRR
jgi:hypothetical protein